MHRSSSRMAIFAFINIQNLELCDVMNFYVLYLCHRDEFSSSAWYKASLKAALYINVKIAILGMRSNSFSNLDCDIWYSFLYSVVGTYLSIRAFHSFLLL